MTLVTLGTQKQQFTRLLDYVENSKLEGEIIVQAGHTKYESKKMKIFDFVDYDEMQKYVNDCDLVITHGGTGSILTPLKKGKKVIACARDQKHIEHVDNHQYQIVDTFTDAGNILKIDETIKLNDVLSKIKDFEPKPYISSTKEFIENLKLEIDK